MGFRRDLNLYASLFGEVIPFIWDSWEDSWGDWIKYFESARLKLVFVTSKSSADHFGATVPGTKFEYVPDATLIRDYKSDLRLFERSIDILELGRKYDSWHDLVTPFIRMNELTHLYEPVQGEIIFKNFHDMANALSNTKIFVCFPLSVTNPKKSGRVETVTQRYFEGMASGCILLGTAPQELIELFGYNPVIEIDWNSPSTQLFDILNSVSQYQDKVDQNFQKVLTTGDWSHRVNQIVSIMSK